MRRSIMSIIVIFMTLVSVFIMLYSDESITVNLKSYIKAEDSEKSEIKDVSVDAVIPSNVAKKKNNLVMFRMSKEEIKDRISKEDRAKLLSLKQKISPIDCLKIEDYFKYQDSETAVVNSITLLKIRLSKEDYKKFREIADKYIYVDRIEKII